MPIVLSPTSEHIEIAARALREGKLVGMPTETVYGLAGNALNASALASIFEVKKRPFFDPLIIHVENYESVEYLCRELPVQAKALMRAFWPGPLTLVMPRAACVPDLATAGLDTVAIRMPAHPVAQALLKAAGIPLAAPSANPFGGLSPTTAAHVAEAFKDDDGMIECVLDGGPCDVGVESTVVGFDVKTGAPLLFRAGGVTLEALENVLGCTLAMPHTDATSAHGPAASPGALPWHYAPRTPLKLRELATSEFEAVNGGDAHAALLTFGPKAVPAGYHAVENLSPSGDMREAAANLFAALHRLDALSLDRIDAVVLPEHGLGRAVNERLRKAAAAPPQR